MTLEINPVGVKCNLSCSYCYENPMREAGNFARKFDLNAVIKTIEKKNTNFTIFGGEPLLAPIETLEALFKIGFDKFKQNGIQSNGLLITEKHIELFKKYNVHVGLSWDGPKVCNTARMSQEESDKLYENFSRLRRAGIGTSLIITLHKLNGIQFRKEFIEWLLWLDANKVN